MKKKRNNRSIVLSLLALWLVVCLAASGGLLYYLGQLSLSRMEMDINTLEGGLDITRRQYDPYYTVSKGIPERLEAGGSGVDVTQMVYQQTWEALERMSEMDYLTGNFALWGKNEEGEMSLLTAPEEGVWIDAFCDSDAFQFAFCKLSDWISQEELEQVESYLDKNISPCPVGESILYQVTIKEGWHDETGVYPTKIWVDSYNCVREENGAESFTPGQIYWEKELSAPESTEGMSYRGGDGIWWLPNHQLYYVRGNYPSVRETHAQIGVEDLDKWSWEAVDSNLYLYRNQLFNIHYMARCGIGLDNAMELDVEGDIPVLKNSLPILGMAWGGSLLLFGLVGGILIVHNNHYEQRRGELEERRRQQARAVAHDLKTPLAVISAYAENISENLHPEKHAQYAGQILEETQRMNGGIQRLLQMDRVEGGQLSLERFDLGQLTRAVLRRYQQSIEEKKLTVRVEGSAQLTGDRELISQVIDNFLSNAVRYTPESGVIEIRLEEGKFSIQNQGKRIPEEKLSHVWEPYYQAEPERNPGGNGLGLTIAKAALDQHGFRCGAKNTGDGVVFYFTW